MTNQNLIVFSSIVGLLFLMTTIGVSLAVSNIFAQETAITTDGNITGGGINVPLNGTNTNTTAESNVSASSTDNTMTNQQTSTGLTSHPFSINTDMMRPVLYLIDPVSDTIITVDLTES